MLYLGHAATVGGDHGEFAVLEAEQHAVKRPAGIFLARGVSCFAEHLAQDRLGDGVDASFFGFGDYRKIARTLAGQTIAGVSGGYGCLVLLVDSNFYNAVFGFGYGGGKKFCGERSGTGYFDFGVDLALDGDVEIGGGEGKAGFGSVDLDVLENGEVIATGDYVLDFADAVDESGAGDLEFHGCC